MHAAELQKPVGFPNHLDTFDIYYLKDRADGVDFYENNDNSSVITSIA